MKYKRCRMVCGLMVAALSMTSVLGCGNSTGTEDDTAVESSQNTNTFIYTDGTEETLVSTTIMASVESVDGNEINVSVGASMEDMANGGDGNGENGAAPTDEANGTAPDGNGANGTAPDGNGANGAAPEAPTGEANGTAPDGNGANETAPDGTGANETAPEAPTGEENGAAPDGNGENGAAPEAPTDGANGTTPDGENGTAPEMPQTVSATALLTINDESVIVVEDEEGNTTEGSLSDVTEGTMLQITFDENGEITEILISANMGPGGSGMDAAMNGAPGNGAVVADSWSDHEVTERTQA